jgi:hypothetical protein
MAIDVEYSRMDNLNKNPKHLLSPNLAINDNQQK